METGSLPSTIVARTFAPARGAWAAVACDAELLVAGAPACCRLACRVGSVCCGAQASNSRAAARTVNPPRVWLMIFLLLTNYPGRESRANRWATPLHSGGTPAAADSMQAAAAARHRAGRRDRLCRGGRLALEHHAAPADRQVHGQVVEPRGIEVEWVVAQHDHVGQLAHREGAEPVLLEAHPGRVGRLGPQRLVDTECLVGGDTRTAQRLVRDGGAQVAQRIHRIVAGGVRAEHQR